MCVVCNTKYAVNLSVLNFSPLSSTFKSEGGMQSGLEYEVIISTDILLFIIRTIV